MEQARIGIEHINDQLNCGIKEEAQNSEKKHFECNLFQFFIYCGRYWIASVNKNAQNVQ